MVVAGWYFILLYILKCCFQMRGLSFVGKRKSQGEICREYVVEGHVVALA